jgi:hypothetical protein
MRPLPLPTFVLPLAIFIGSAVAAITAVSYTLNIGAKDSAAVVGTLLTAISIFLAFLAIRNVHEWNRRHFTVELTSGWNSEARRHLASISTDTS